jgi:hypothetical protein
LSITASLNILSGIFMIFAAIVPLFIVIRVRTLPLRILSALMAGFTLLHGSYHFIAGFEMEELELLGEVVFEPFAWLCYLGFVIYYSWRGGA